MAWGSARASSPPRARAQPSVSHLRAPAPQSRYVPCVSGLPVTAGSCGLPPAPRTALAFSSRLWTCKHHTFFLPFRSCCNVLLRKKPICKSGQSRNGSADLSACAGDSVEVQFCLWNFALAAWVQLKMTVMIIKGLLYLKDHTVFCVKDRAVRAILWR